MGFLAKPHVFGSPVDSLREVFDMTQKQTAEITQLREQGLSVAKIAEAVGIPLNTVKSWCRRHPQVTDEACLQCGSPVRQRPHAKKKRFCSDRCRLAWWSQHPEARKCGHTHICRYCGAAFQTNRLGSAYCSVACFADARRKAAAHE